MTDRFVPAGGLLYVAGMAEPAERHMSLTEFLEWDDGTGTRYELIDGRPVAMVPPIEAHGTIVANLAAAIRPKLRPPCRVVVEAGITPADRADTWYQPDLVVTFAPAERGARAIPEPRLIVEVLAPSRAAHDRGVKLADYRKIASVEQILMGQARIGTSRSGSAPRTAGKFRI